MRRSIFAILAFLSVSAIAQAQFILLNANVDEHASCLSDNVLPNATVANCGPSAAAGMRLGRTVRLRVLHRHFLTGYSLAIGDRWVDPPAPHFGGAVYAVLLPGAQDAIPSLPARIERKNAGEFLGKIVDVTASPEPLAEIERENQELSIEKDQVRSVIDNFTRELFDLFGDGPINSCQTMDIQLRADWLEACMHGEFAALQTFDPVILPLPAPPAPPPPPFTTAPTTDPNLEAAFRRRVIEVDRLFQQASEFSVKLAQVDLSAKARTAEAAIRRYEQDEVSFWANLDAAMEAVWITDQLQNAPSDSALPLRLRGLLRTEIAAGAAKPALDEAETNLLIDHYIALLKTQNGFPQQWRQKLQNRIGQFQARARDLDSVDKDLNDIRAMSGNRMPGLVSEINDWQQRLAARVNEIYLASDLPITESDWELSPISAPGVVSYRIMRTSELEPFVFRQTTVPGTDSHALELSRGAFAVTPAPIILTPKRTVWQLLRLTK